MLPWVFALANGSFMPLAMPSIEPNSTTKWNPRKRSAQNEYLVSTEVFNYLKKERAHMRLVNRSYWMRYKYETSLMDKAIVGWLTHWWTWQPLVAVATREWCTSRSQFSSLPLLLTILTTQPRLCVHWYHPSKEWSSSCLLHITPNMTKMQEPATKTKQQHNA